MPLLFVTKSVIQLGTLVLYSCENYDSKILFCMNHGLISSKHKVTDVPNKIALIKVLNMSEQLYKFKK